MLQFNGRFNQRAPLDTQDEVSGALMAVIGGFEEKEKWIKPRKDWDTEEEVQVPPLPVFYDDEGFGFHEYYDPFEDE
jgi:hypothetical protein